MDAIDVRDLPEEEARLIQKLVDHLKSLRKTSQAVKEEDWGHVAMTAFTHDWDNDKDAAYDNWQAHYHVSAG